MNFEYYYGTQADQFSFIRIPRILLLDEAFSALDYQTRLMVTEDIFKILKAENITALMVTHDISEAISMSDRVIVLSERPATVKTIHKILRDKGRLREQAAVKRPKRLFSKNTALC